MIHFDTSFVVDFLRETSRDDPGPATALLLAGAALAQRGDEERQKVREFCATLPLPTRTMRLRTSTAGSSARSSAPDATQERWTCSSPPPPCAKAPAWSPATGRISSISPDSISSLTEKVTLLWQKCTPGCASTHAAAASASRAAPQDIQDSIRARGSAPCTPWPVEAAGPTEKHEKPARTGVQTRHQPATAGFPCFPAGPWNSPRASSSREAPSEARRIPQLPQAAASSHIPFRREKTTARRSSRRLRQHPTGLAPVQWTG